MGYYEEIFNQDVADEAMRMDAKEEGRAEGIAEGMEKVKKVAVKLLADGMNPEKVSELTDLSIEKVRSLMESQTNRNMNGSTAVQL